MQNVGRRHWAARVFPGVRSGLASLAMLIGLGVLAAGCGQHAETVGPAGELLSSSTITSGLPASVRGWRITYMTTDGEGHRVKASGVVVVGTAAHPGKRPVVSYAHATTGIGTECAPSLKTGFPVSSIGAAQFLARGWAVVQTDYIGLGLAAPQGVSPYLDGPAEGHAVLDATRAAQSLAGLNLADNTLIYGVSQGGQAALFAGAEAPTYAPKLDVLGVAAAAPATDLVGVFKAFGKTVPGLMVSSFLAVSWDATYPDARVRDHVSDWTAAKAIAGDCATAMVTATKHLGVAPLFRAKDFTGKVGELFSENTPTAPIGEPLLIGQGLADTIVSPAVQKKYVASRCAAGQHLEFRTYAGRTHLTIDAPGSPFVTYLMDWAEARLAGKAPTPTC